MILRWLLPGKNLCLILHAFAPGMRFRASPGGDPVAVEAGGPVGVVHGWSGGAAQFRSNRSRAVPPMMFAIVSEP